MSPFQQIALTKDEKAYAKDYIKNKLRLMYGQANGGQEVEVARVELPPQQVPDIMMPGMDLVLDLIENGEADNMEEVSAFELAFKTDIERLEKDSMIALQKYKTSREPEGDPLEYWNHFRYNSQSGLADLACDTLVAQAASVSSERMFSSAGSLSKGTRKSFQVLLNHCFILGKMHNISAKNLECRVLLRANKDL